MNLIRQISCYLLMGCAVFAGAQAPAFRAHPNKEYPDSRTKVVYQDRQGWIWAGGKNGLYRYNGWRFAPIRLPEQYHEEITAIFEAGNKIWLGFKSGQIGYIATDQPHWMADDSQSTDPSFQPWEPEEGTPSSPISGFAADASGNLWIATYGEGLYCWRENRLYLFDEEGDQLCSNDIYAIARSGTGEIWAATDAGIAICSMPAKNRKMLRHLSKSDGLVDEINTALLPGSDGSMWIGTYDNGVCRYNPKLGTVDYHTDTWTGGHVTSLQLYGDQELWIGTSEFGCITLDIDSKALRQLPEQNTLHRKKTKQLLKDREGLLWVVTENGALYTGNPRWGVVPAPETQTLYHDCKQRLWIGTSNGLMCRYGEQWKTVIARENVISIAELQDGTLLAGTFGNGLFLLTADGRILQHITEKNGLPNGSILSIAAADDGAWLATLGGVVFCKYAAGKLGACEALEALGAVYVYKLYLDKRKTLWLGTDGKGLWRLENGRLQRFDSVEGKPIRTVYDIAEDREHRIWFCVPNEGLFFLENGECRRFSATNRLHNPNILSLAINNSGEIVLGYEDGIDMLNPATGHVVFNDASSGLPANGVVLNADAVDAGGHIWLGTNAGALRIASFGEIFTHDPLPAIEAVSVFMKPVDFYQVQEFDYDQNYFNFHFDGLWFSNPDAVRFRYRLDGYDLDWHSTKDHQASYSNLTPGHYVFRFQSTEHGDFAHTPEARYSFTIRTPFWRRWWFVTLAILSAGGLLYFWIRHRERRYRREAQLKKEIADSQFAALKSQINPHFLFNSFNTLIALIEETPIQAVEYVEHLSDFYRTMLAYREKDLISLQEELVLVEDYCFLLRKRFEQNFILQNSARGQGLIIPLTLQILIENAVKHNVISKANPLRVEIFVENDRWLVVRNNLQPKITPEPSTHFGLKSLIDRYRLLGDQTVLIEKSAQYFTVRVPIIRL